MFRSKVYESPRGDDPALFLEDWIALVSESGIDTYICNVNAQVPWYPSRAVPQILTGYQRGDLDFPRGLFPPPNDTDFPVSRLEERRREQVELLDRFLDLQEAGVDWVARIVAACRARGVAPWAGVRMNDMHGSNNWSECHMNCPPQRNPKLRLSGRTIYPFDPPSTKLQAVSYDHQETRDFMFAMIRELILEYDFEGIELDWMRCPFCCEPPAAQERIETMTEWLAQIRDLTREKARLTGQPYPLGLRTPVRTDLLRHIGLDVREYARRGLIDFVIPSNYFQSTWDVPYEALRKELGPDMAIYGSIEATPNWLQVFSPRMEKAAERFIPACPELLRGNAAGKLASGADGIEFFNYFVADEDRRRPFADKSRRGANYPALRGASDMEFLRAQPKQYVLASMTGGHMFPVWEYAEQLPIMLRPGEKRSFRLSMCAEPESAKLEVIVQIVVAHNNSGSDKYPMGLSFNGSWPSFDAILTDQLLFPCGDFTHHLPEHQAYEFRLLSSLVKEGWNEVLLFGGREPARVLSVEVALRKAR